MSDVKTASSGDKLEICSAELAGTDAMPASHAVEVVSACLSKTIVLLASTAMGTASLQSSNTETKMVWYPTPISGDCISSCIQKYKQGIYPVSIMDLYPGCSAQQWHQGPSYARQGAL